MAAKPVVTVALAAFRAASMTRLWLGANSLARNARNLSKTGDGESINGRFLLLALHSDEPRGRRRALPHAIQRYSPFIVTTAVCPMRNG